MKSLTTPVSFPQDPVSSRPAEKRNPNPTPADIPRSAPLRSLHNNKESVSLQMALRGHGAQGSAQTDSVLINVFHCLTCPSNHVPKCPDTGQLFFHCVGCITEQINSFPHTIQKQNCSTSSAPTTSPRAILRRSDSTIFTSLPSVSHFPHKIGHQHRRSRFREKFPFPQARRKFLFRTYFGFPEILFDPVLPHDQRAIWACFCFLNRLSNCARQPQCAKIFLCKQLFFPTLLSSPCSATKKHDARHVFDPKHRPIARCWRCRCARRALTRAHNKSAKLFQIFFFF